MIFNYKYFLTTIFLFLAEVSIATIFKDIIWLRAYFGDVLVVILIYTFILSFFEINDKNFLNLGVFLFACVIEFAQYFHFAEWFGLKDNTIAMIILGNSFLGLIFCAMQWVLFVFLLSIRF